MSKIRKNLTLGQSTLDKADKLIELLDCDDLSGLTALLIREETERRSGPITLPGAAMALNETTPLDSDKLYNQALPTASGVPAALAEHTKEFASMKEALKKGKGRKTAKR